jgi:hypothetical protein
MADDVLVRFARRYRETAAAALIDIIQDPNAPASSRAQAARDILSYSDGRPGQAKPITVADLGNMSDEQRRELLHVLVTHYFPGGIEALIKQAVEDAFTANALAVKPPRFTRGPVLAASLPQQRTHKPPARRVHAEEASERMHSRPATLLPPENALKSNSESAAKSPDPGRGVASTTQRVRIGDIPIDRDVSEFIQPRPNGSGGNGRRHGPDYVTALERYNQATRWRNGR